MVDQVQLVSSEADEVACVQSAPSEAVEADSVAVRSAVSTAVAVVRSAGYCRGIMCQFLGALAF